MVQISRVASDRKTLGLPSVIYKEFMRNINDAIDVFNKSTNKKIKKIALEKIQEKIQYVDFQTPPSNLVGSFHEIRKKLFSQIKEAYAEIGVDTLCQSDKNYSPIARIVTDMSQDKADRLMEILSKREHDNLNTELKALYDSTDFSPEANQWRTFLETHSIEFLGGINSKNFKVINTLDNSIKVLKVDLQVGPRNVEHNLRGALPDVFTPTEASRQVLGKIQDKYELESRNLLVTDYCTLGSVYAHGEKVRKEGIDATYQSATEMMSQMTQVFLDIQNNNCFFPDAKPTNWLVDVNGKIRVADTKSILATKNGQYDAGPIGEVATTEEFSMEFIKPNNVYDAEKIHANLLGRNIYNYLTGIMPPGIVFKWNHPIFEGSIGNEYKLLIINLTRDPPSSRMSLKDAQIKLQELRTQLEFQKREENQSPNLGNQSIQLPDINKSLHKVFENFLQGTQSAEEVTEALRNAFKEKTPQERAQLINHPSPLLPLAVRANNSSWVRILLNNGADPNDLQYMANNNLLRDAAINKNPEIIDLLLVKGVSYHGSEGLSSESTQFIIDALIRTKNPIHAPAIRDALDYQSKIQNQEHSVIETEVDLMIVIGPDERGEFSHQAARGQFIDDCKKRGIKVHIVGNGNDFIQDQELAHLPKSKNLILLGHGSARHNNHRIDVMQNERNTLNVIKNIQDKTGCSNIITLSCYGGLVIDNEKASNQLKPGTTIFAPSPNDEPSLLMNNIDIIKISIEEIGTNNGNLNLMNLTQNCLEKFSETACFMYVPENSNQPSESATMKGNHQIHTQNTDFNAGRISTLNTYLKDVIDKNPGDSLKNNLGSLVLDDKGGPETKYHKIKMIREQTPGYQLRSNHYKNNELTFHISKGHSDDVFNILNKLEHSNKQKEAIFLLNSTVAVSSPEAYKVLPSFVKSGASIYQDYPYGPKKMSVFDYALNSNKLPLIRNLCKSNEQDQNGRFPMDIILQQESGKNPPNIALITSLLNERDVMFNRNNNTTMTAINKILKQEVIQFEREPSIESINTLINAGASIHGPGSEIYKGHSLLTFAIVKNNYKLFKLLVDKGADLNFKMPNEAGDSPLTFCLKREPINPVMVKILIDKGANLNQCNNFNQTPLDLIKALPDNNIKETLISFVPKEMLIDQQKMFLNQHRMKSELNEGRKIVQNISDEMMDLLIVYKNVNGIPQTPSNLVELWQEREKIKNTIISEIIKLGIDENQESTWKAESRNPNGFVLENYKKLVTPEVYNVLKECFEKAQEEITRPSFKYN